MKVMVDNIKGKLISLTKENGKYEIEMQYEGYDVEFHEVEEKDITVIME